MSSPTDTLTDTELDRLRARVERLEATLSESKKLFYFGYKMARAAARCDAVTQFECSHKAEGLFNRINDALREG